MALDEREKQTAVWLAAGRVAIGGTLLLAPGLLRRFWIGDDAARPATKVVVRAFGARDMALGIGSYLALQDEKSDTAAKTWLQLAGACDVVDAASTLLGLRSLSKGRALLALAAAGTGAATSFRLAAKA